MDILTTLYNPPEPKITIGAWYRIRKVDGNGKSLIVRCRAIWKNRRLVMFETEKGIRECWSYWDLERSML